MLLAARGYRCIAHDRRGHRRSGQPWNGNEMDTYADDLAALVEALDLKNAIHVGHSTGGGKVTRLHRPSRHQTRGQGGAHQRDTAADAEDAGQSRRLANRSVRPAPRRGSGRPFAALQVPERSVLRSEPSGTQGLAGRARYVLDAGLNQGEDNLVAVGGLRQQRFGHARTAHAGPQPYSG